MNKDAISRCELFNRLATLPAPAEANKFKAEVYKIIQEMETEDRPQGEWIIHYRDKWMVRAECPKCHRRFEFSPRAIWKCCPMCETRMKGADDETAND